MTIWKVGSLFIFFLLPWGPPKSQITFVCLVFASSCANRRKWKCRKSILYFKAFWKDTMIFSYILNRTLWFFHASLKWTLHTCKGILALDTFWWAFNILLYISSIGQNQKIRQFGWVGADIFAIEHAWVILRQIRPDLQFYWIQVHSFSLRHPA